MENHKKHDVKKNPSLTLLFEPARKAIFPSQSNVTSFKHCTLGLKFLYTFSVIKYICKIYASCFIIKYKFREQCGWSANKEA